MFNSNRITVSCLLVATLAGCQGSAGPAPARSTPTDAPAPAPEAHSEAPDPGAMDGIFIGTLGVSAGGSHFAIAIVQQGRFIAYDPDASHVYDGTLDVQRGNFDGAIAVYQGAGLERSTRADIDGVFEARQFINAALRPPSGQHGQASLDYSSLHERRASLFLLTDLWTRHDADSAEGTMLLIDERGVLDGGNGEGCIYRGLVSLEDERQNIYGISLSILNCEQLNGDYDGFALIREDADGRDTLVMVITDGRHAQILELDRSSARPIDPTAIPVAG